MNTVFHVHNDEFNLIASVLFNDEPKNVFGHHPVVGEEVLLGYPFNDSADPEEEVTFILLELKEEKGDDGAPALGCKLAPKRKLNS